MKSFAMVVLVGCALAAIGCEEKKADVKPAASAAPAAPAKAPAAPAKSAAPGGGW